MRTAAYHMVKHMAAGMALITCRDPLLVTISKHLRNAFVSRGVSDDQKIIDQAANQVSIPLSVALSGMVTFQSPCRLLTTTQSWLVRSFRRR